MAKGYGGGGRGGGKASANNRVAAKRQAAVDDDEPPGQLQREESDNTKIKRAIKKVRQTPSQEKKDLKPDSVLGYEYPQATVYEDYGCMLNQTNISNNNNKFYIIQVAQNEDEYITFTRWGRVGETGRHKFDIHDKAEVAINAFKKKFKEKTKNDWDKREDFATHPGKYTMIEIDYEEKSEDTVDIGRPKKDLLSCDEACSLPMRTQLMIALIFSSDMFVDQMSTMKLDVKKMPLGNLTKIQITKGLEILINIEDAIKKDKPKEILTDLSSQFYTLVPHDFGRTQPPVIESVNVIREKKEIMLTLSDIELTLSLQKDKLNTGRHPLIEKYEMLECNLEYVDKESSEFKLLQKYATACPHSRKGPLLDIWRVDRHGERERFEAHDVLKNRKLLWHGTGVAAVAAILKAGLRIMPHASGLVGKGLYFASEHEKSSWYVIPHYGQFEGEEMVGFMFLAEVALGKEHSITKSDYSVTKAPKGYDSIVARGNNEPDPKDDKSVEMEGKEVIVPVGNPVPQQQWSASDFCQSEYVVYKESQARIRYLLKFSFKHNIM